MVESSVGVFIFIFWVVVVGDCDDGGSFFDFRGVLESDLEKVGGAGEARKGLGLQR